LDRLARRTHAIALDKANARREKRLRTAIEAVSEHGETELAVTRDELLAKIDAKQFGLADDRPLDLAEKAVGELRTETRAGTDKLGKQLAGFEKRLDAVELRKASKEIAPLLMRLGLEYKAGIKALEAKLDQRAERNEEIAKRLDEVCQRLVDARIIPEEWGMKPLIQKWRRRRPWDSGRLRPSPARPVERMTTVKGQPV
jgi:hypothetical protein